MNNILVSVIIPFYNEEEVIIDCLNSLKNQTYKRLEIIVIDDGSTDKTVQIVQTFKVKLLKQNHNGPGSARNLGAKIAKGEILVFVDSDMSFDKYFIRDLVAPILQGKSIGTFSKNEMNANPENPWSAFWNINRGLPPDRLIPQDYPNQAPVFRAILKKEFDKVKGFDETGEYTDDWSLSKKLGIKSTIAKGAIYYHINPSSFKEYWQQARWYGKNEFILGTPLRRMISIMRYSFPVSLAIGVYQSIVKSKLSLFIFKLIFDFAIWISVFKSFIGESKSK